MASADEYRLKAAFLYNFSQFIEWPAHAFAQADSPFTICVLGSDPFGELLQALQRRSHHGRPILIAYPRTLAEARNCHILYAEEPRSTPLGRDPGKALGDAPVLTVGSGSQAVDNGMGIGFVLQGGRIRWVLNLEAARRAQLKVSAKLIEIAVSVVGEAGR